MIVIDKPKFVIDNASLLDIKNLFKKTFIEEENKFDKTLFRFLINRLKEVNDDFAYNYSLSIFIDRPEETETILKYFSSIGKNEIVINSLFNFLNSDESIYDYQNYLIIKWAIENKCEW